MGEGQRTWHPFQDGCLHMHDAILAPRFAPFEELVGL
jgi:hypothetical protein